jgi:CRP-like cAMP-binding protein
MISPELLRRYPIFGGFPEATLRDIAMLSQEKKFKGGTRLFSESGRLPEGERFLQPAEPARALMVVTQGEIDLVTILGNGKQVFVLTAVSGDLLGLSSLVEARGYLLTAVARTDGSLISIDAVGLRALCAQDNALGYRLMHKIASDLRLRLAQAVAQLAGMS